VCAQRRRQVSRRPLWLSLSVAGQKLKSRVNKASLLMTRFWNDLPPQPLARWAAAAFTFCIWSLVISIAVNQIFLGLAGVLYAAHLLAEKPGRIIFPPIRLPLMLYVLATVISIFFAENPAAGGYEIRKMTLLLLLLFTPSLVVTRDHRRRLLEGLFAAASLAALVSVWQFVRQYRTARALHALPMYQAMTFTRITGFMGHWMNFGGQQMQVFLLLLAFLMLAKASGGIAAAGGPGSPAAHCPNAIRAGAEGWLARAGWGGLLLIGVSLVLNFTRGVWLGVLAGAVHLVSRWRARWLLALPVLLAILFLASPALLRKRLESFLHPTADPSIAIRYEMWQAGFNMMRRHPLTGVGPNNIYEVYPLYVPHGRALQIGYHEHLHNDVIQLGAERGLPCLAAWLWMMGALGWQFWKRARAGGGSAWVADGAFAVWMAFMVEGCFEFNFGSSPVLMVFLFVAGLPFAALDGAVEKPEARLEVGAGR
jgi:O-antigen ligase